MDNPVRTTISQGMGTKFDIIVAGAGLNGCTMALALAASGFSVALIDRQDFAAMKDAEFDGRGYAIAHASHRMLKALGIWAALGDHTTPMLKIKISDGRPGEGGGPHVLEFDHAEIEEGPMGFMVEDRVLRPVLIEQCQAHPLIEVFAPVAVNDATQNSAATSVTLSDGQGLRARLVVGCDGANSPLAEAAGISRSFTDYGQTALVCAVSHAKPHDGTAHQFFMPAGPLAILPLTDNRSSIVWAETTENAARIARLDDEAFLAELRPRFGDFLGPIALAGKRFDYPLVLSTAENLVADRLALVGDAGHKVHPIAGQGLNAGLRDVATLAEVLTLAKRRGEDVGASDVLARYQRWRAFDVKSLTLATHGFNKLFSNDNMWLRMGRDLGLDAVAASPALRISFIREAAGLTGELPALLEGRAI